MTHELWSNLNAHIFAYLRSVSLAQLVADQDKPDVNGDARSAGQPARRASPSPRRSPEESLQAP